MTQREFFTAVVNANLSDEMTAHATAEIAKLDKRNATPSKAEREKAEQNNVLKAQILGILSALDEGEAVSAAFVAETIGVSVQKASALLRQICEAGLATQSEAKVKGKGKVKVYVATAPVPAETK